MGDEHDEPSATKPQHANTDAKKSQADDVTKRGSKRVSKTPRKKTFSDASKQDGKSNANSVTHAAATGGLEQANSVPHTEPLGKISGGDQYTKDKEVAAIAQDPPGAENNSETRTTDATVVAETARVPMKSPEARLETAVHVREDPNGIGFADNDKQARQVDAGVSAVIAAVKMNQAIEKQHHVSIIEEEKEKMVQPCRLELWFIMALCVLASYAFAFVRVFDHGGSCHFPWTSPMVFLVPLIGAAGFIRVMDHRGRYNPEDNKKENGEEGHTIGIQKLSRWWVWFQIPYAMMRGPVNCCGRTEQEDVFGTRMATVIAICGMSSWLLILWLCAAKVQSLKFTWSAQMCKRLYILVKTVFVCGFVLAAIAMKSEEDRYLNHVDVTFILFGSYWGLILIPLLVILVTCVVTIAITSVTIMWWSASEASKQSDAASETVQESIYFLKVTAILTLMSFLMAPLKFGLQLIAAFAGNLPWQWIVFSVAIVLDFATNMLCVLCQAGFVGPRAWAHLSEDALGKVCEVAGYAFASGKRIAFEGRIHDMAKVCVASFPGKYAELWDMVVQMALNSTCLSLVCVFLTDVSSGLGQHEDDPDNPGYCYCKSLYGEVHPITYVSFFEEDKSKMDIETYENLLNAKRADAKAMGQVFVVRRDAESTEEWELAKKKALGEAYRQCKQNNGRAPWGCMWFVKWKKNVDIAVSKKQKLVVYYFEGKRGCGKVRWDDLSNADVIKAARSNSGLGASQTAEVAYLDKMNYCYEEVDVGSFEEDMETLQ